MSTSPSPNKAFWRALGLVIGGLTVGIFVLALLVTASGPRVRQVAVQNQTGERISSVSQGLTVVFDRPIVGSDFESAIEFDPEVEYTVSHRQGQLSITFDQNLLSNTEYVLTIKPEIEDEAGRRMEGEYRYEFTTEEPSFTYLERNYDGRGAVDRIIQRAPLSGESQILYGEDRIKSFARNGRYLAVVVPRRDNSDELRVVDVATLEERSLDIPASMRVDNLRFSPIDNQLVFIPRARSGRMPAIPTARPMPRTTSSTATTSTAISYNPLIPQATKATSRGRCTRATAKLYCTRRSTAHTT